jgi:hypothetical protein
MGFVEFIKFVEFNGLKVKIGDYRLNSLRLMLGKLQTF